MRRTVNASILVAVVAAFVAMSVAPRRRSHGRRRSDLATRESLRQTLVLPSARTRVGMTCARSARCARR